MSSPAPSTESAPSSPPKFFSPAWIAALLALVTVLIFWPATNHEFISYDDPDYVTENVHVLSGFTWEGVKWIFTHPVSANWHPVTMLSHMADCQFYGAKPWGHHLTNILLHGINVALVFLLLRQLTGAVWRSLLVAALFAVHPLRLESVAWVAERKDVLSGCFGLLTLLFYAKYAARAKNVSGQTKVFFISSVLFFALGLMSKPMLVTLPCVMLLLDVWPLQRISSAELNLSRLKPLLLEKIPFVLLTVAGSFATFTVQDRSGATMSEDVFPLGVRVGNALVSYGRYLEKTFWPTDLAIFYPHPGSWPIGVVLVAVIFLSIISLLFFLRRHAQPFLLIGWLWFLGMLVPVIGLVQVGEQAMADRYTYFPSIGLLLLLVWGGNELLRRWNLQKVGILICAIAIGANILVTRQQLAFWNNDEALFRHALAVTKNNFPAHNNLGIVFLNRQQYADAAREFTEVVRLKPAAAESHNNLGNALLNLGRREEAIAEFETAIRLRPEFAPAHCSLGLALLGQGKNEAAVVEFQEAVRLKPDFFSARMNLGVALVGLGRAQDALEHYEVALRLKPDDANAHYNLGIAQLKLGELALAVGNFQTAAQLKPTDTEVQQMFTRTVDLKATIEAVNNPADANNLAWILAANWNPDVRNGVLAVRLAERACEQTKYEIPQLIGTLAAAYAEAGRFDDAIVAVKKVIAMASERNETELVQRNQALLALYEKHQAYHEPPPVGAR